MKTIKHLSMSENIINKAAQTAAAHTDRFLADTAKAVASRLATDKNYRATLIASFPSLVEKIVTLANSQHTKFYGHYDRAASMADALKGEPALLKAWGEAVKGRIPYSFVTNKAGMITLSKKNPALLMSEAELKAAEQAKAENKANGLAKAQATRKEKEAKAGQADALKSALVEKDNELLKERQAVIAANSKLAAAADTMALADKLVADTEAAKAAADKATKAAQAANDKLATVEKEKDALKGVEAALAAERVEVARLQKELQKVKADLADALTELAALKAPKVKRAPTKKAA